MLNYKGHKFIYCNQNDIYYITMDNKYEEADTLEEAIDFVDNSTQCMQKILKTNNPNRTDKLLVHKRRKVDREDKTCRKYEEYTITKVRNWSKLDLAYESPKALKPNDNYINEYTSDIIYDSLKGFGIDGCLFNKEYL